MEFIHGIMEPAEAVTFLDQKLTEALENGDAAAAEIVLIDLLGAAAALKDLVLLKNVRIMRLELFCKTGQRMKSRDEYDALKIICNQDELREIKEFVDFDPSITVKADKPLLEQIETYFIVDKLFLKNNGILNSVMRKITLFEEVWGYRPVLVFVEHSQDLKGNMGYHQYFNASRLNTNLKMQNVYGYFQKNELPGLPIIEHQMNDEDFVYINIAPNTYEVYEGNKLVRYMFFNNPHNRLNLIQHVNEEGVITHAEFYDKMGYKDFIREMDPEDPEQYISQSYYTTEGNLCIKSMYTFKNNEHVLTNIVLYGSDNNILLEGTDEADLLGFYLEQKASVSSSICFFVNESALHNKAMAAITQKNVIKATVVHNAFLEDSYNLKSKPQKFFIPLVRYQRHFDGIVFLTNLEANDWRRIYGKPQRIFTVPHFYPNSIERVDFDSRNHRKAVIVSRIDLDQKCLDVAVDVMKLVVGKHPDVTLDIYGFGAGDHEQRLREHIIKTGMENHVFMKGSTERPEEVFRNGVLFMMTSRVEGMPLTLLESVSNGCPIISYDIKYGPSDVIRNGRTGYLIPRGNVKAFAKQMISYFDDLGLQRQMCENAYDDAVRFSKEVFLENWYNFMQTIYARYEAKIAGQSSNFQEVAI